MSTTESRLRLWNGAALAFVGVLAGLQPELLRGPPQTAAGYALAAIGALLVGGFWLRMLFECGVSKGLRRKPAWLAVVLFFPIFGAFIYFASVRSLRCERAAGGSWTS